ncbi:bombyxin B-6 [Danaus plexippus]|uniref:Insulin peptide n=1 Tax=Danaus plexippus plexippus TaxID=278856 RepID=A0A212EZ83_DANPL|nr:bombyxin B-6 isoform X2 [Danaus plexippus plexippus]XP_032527831.1 bombyxin B-6 [Danaus plexippus]XP_032527832.1 bombyxin B-6 isoform X2 [Danaus plexippus plexippus]OWR46809.1 insulin peptide precursor [Danaus plexippus plexippus]
MKLLVFMTAIVLSAATSRTDDGPRVFCGRALAEARVLYCFGSKITDHVKRVEKHDLQTSQFYFWPWMAVRFYSLRKRIPGLVDECCLKPCYVSQLLSYC